MRHMWLLTLLFKAKVPGISIGASVIASAVITIIVKSGKPKLGLSGYGEAGWTIL